MAKQSELHKALGEIVQSLTEEELQEGVTIQILLTEDEEDLVVTIEVRKYRKGSGQPGPSL